MRRRPWNSLLANFCVTLYILSETPLWGSPSTTQKTMSEFHDQGDNVKKTILLINSN
jgi:hypothetical protein